MLILGLIVFNPWRKSLYEEYSTATTMSVAERGEGTETNLEKAAAFYNNKEFIRRQKSCWQKNILPQIPKTALLPITMPSPL
jgi:hypothetical protein